MNLVNEAKYIMLRRKSRLQTYFPDKNDAKQKTSDKLRQKYADLRFQSQFGTFLLYLTTKKTN